MSHVRSAQGTDTASAVHSNVTPLFAASAPTPPKSPALGVQPANTPRYAASFDCYNGARYAQDAAPLQDAIARWGMAGVSVIDPAANDVVSEGPANELPGPKRGRRRARHRRKTTTGGKKAGLSCRKGTIRSLNDHTINTSTTLPWRKIGSRRWRRKNDFRIR